MTKEYHVKTLLGSVIVTNSTGEEVARHRNRALATEDRNRRNGRIFPKPNPSDKRNYRFWTNNRGVSKVYLTATGEVVSAHTGMAAARQIRDEMEAAKKAA